MKKILNRTKEEKKLLDKCLALFFIAIGLDQITKQLIATNKDLMSKHIILIPGFFNIVHVRNTGAAWGIFHNNNTILLFVALIAFIILLYSFRNIAEGFAERYIALTLILSGIVGNSLDRIFRQSVVDFLDFHIKSLHWPAFNLADSSICIGVTLLLISLILRPSKKKAKP